jgi:hypothetical protein
MGEARRRGVAAAAVGKLSARLLPATGLSAPTAQMKMDNKAGVIDMNV